VYFSGVAKVTHFPLLPPTGSLRNPFFFKSKLKKYLIASQEKLYVLRLPESKIVFAHARQSETRPIMEDRVRTEVLHYQKRRLFMSYKTAVKAE